MNKKYPEHIFSLGLTSTLIMTGESVSGLLVVVDSLGTSWPWETEFSSKAAAAPSLLSSLGLWHFSMSCSSSVESTALTELLISAKPKRKSLCDKKRWWTNKWSKNTRFLSDWKSQSDISELEGNFHWKYQEGLTIFVIWILLFSFGLLGVTARGPLKHSTFTKVRQRKICRS